MKSLNPNQIAHFAYWLLEQDRFRTNVDGLTKVDYIEKILLPEFLSKYPNGVLTGWSHLIENADGSSRKA
jgi:hypothetical protein